MVSKIRTLIWYLQNPKLLPDAWLKIKARLFYASAEKSGMKAKAWCSLYALSQEEAFAQLFPGHPFQKIENRFTEEYKYGMEQVAKSGYVMGGSGAIDLLYNLCEATQSCKILETGVAYGWSTVAILLSISTRPNASLISIDMPYAKVGNENFVGTVIPEHLRNSWTLFRESDFTGIPKAISRLGQLDLCHYDSDKSYLGRKRSNKLIWKALKKNGFFISDDISDNIAFKEFCESVCRTPIIVYWNNKYIGIVKK
ncbi:MAG TPA: class I SAM-dependent methyltransferase [Chitinophagaceae bacterium]|nr:class I SAM-dependent methyltransferase [Chitinophagaceae bacterium]